MGDFDGLFKQRSDQKRLDVADEMYSQAKAEEYLAWRDSPEGLKWQIENGKAPSGLASPIIRKGIEEAFKKTREQSGRERATALQREAEDRAAIDITPGGEGADAGASLPGAGLGKQIKAKPDPLEPSLMHGYPGLSAEDVRWNEIFPQAEDMAAKALGDRYNARPTEGEAASQRIAEGRAGESIATTPKPAEITAADFAKGLGRAIIGLETFLPSAVWNVMASAAGKSGGGEGFFTEGTQPGGKTDVEMMNKLREKGAEVVEHINTTITGAQTEGGARVEHALLLPLEPLNLIAEKTEAAMFALTGDHFLSSAAGLTALMLSFKAVGVGVRDAKILASNVQTYGPRAGLERFIRGQEAAATPLAGTKVSREGDDLVFEVGGGKKVRVRLTDIEIGESEMARMEAAQRTKIESGEEGVAGRTVPTEEGYLVEIDRMLADSTTPIHEAVHALREQFTPEEWKALEEASGGVGEEAVASMLETATQQIPVSLTGKVYRFFKDKETAPLAEVTQRKFARGEIAARTLEGEGVESAGVRQTPKPGESLSSFQQRTITPQHMTPPRQRKDGSTVGAIEPYTTARAEEGLVRRLTNAAVKMYEVNPRQALWFEEIGGKIRQAFGVYRDAGGEWQGNTKDADTFMRALAAWSARMPVDRNVQSAVEVMFRLAEGRELDIPGAVTSGPEMAARFEKIMEAEEVATDLRGIGPKIDAYYWAIHNGTYGIKDYKNAVLDTHMIAAADLKKKGGGAWDRGLKPQQYAWYRNVIEKVGQRFNKATGADLPLHGVQALVWEWNRVGKAAIKADPETLGKYVGVGITLGEVIPAINSDVARFVHDLPYAGKKAFSDTLLSETLYSDTTGNDVILEMITAPQGGTRKGTGTWEGAINPNVTKSMLLRGGPADLALAELYADIFGYVYTQNSVLVYSPDATIAESSDHPGGVAIRRANGEQISPLLLPSFYERLRKKMPGLELNFPGDEIVIIDFSGLPREGFYRKVTEVANEWAKEGAFDADVWQFGARAAFKNGDPDGSARWSGRSYRERILAAGGPDLLRRADSLREGNLRVAADLEHSLAAGPAYQFLPKVDRGLITKLESLGVTKDWGAAGWLLPDGRMINIRDHEFFGYHEASHKAAGIDLTVQQVGARSGSVRIYYDEGSYPTAGGRVRTEDLSVEFFGPPSIQQLAKIQRKIGPDTALNIDISDPNTRAHVEGALGIGVEGRKILADLVRRAYPEFYAEPSRPKAPEGLPQDYNGWEYDGSYEGGLHQYTNRNPKDPLYRNTIAIKDISQIDKKISDLGEKYKSAPQFQTRPKLYSTARQIVEERFPDGIKGASAINLLSRFGAKKAELDDLKMLGFLQGRDRVTKADLIDYIDTASVKVKEIVLGEEKPVEIKWRDDPDGSAAYASVGGRTISITKTRWGSYELQTGSGIGLSANTLQEAKAKAEEFLRQPQRTFPTATVERPTKYDTYTLPGGENYRELLLTAPDPHVGQWEVFDAKTGRTISYYGDREAAEIASEKTPGSDYTERMDYRSSHWGEENVLAHVRFNDRTTEDGKRTLFVEEFQSDWSRKWREQKDDPAAPLQGDYVPQPDFTGDWRELTAKRMLLWSAERGYDSISWTTGKQQQERYDLSKAVDIIGWDKFADDDRIHIYGNKGGDEVFFSIYPPEGLAAVIGKDAAQKIIDGGSQGELKGLDLKVGGEWALHLYDKVFPGIFDKLAKKYGVQVGEAKIVGPTYNMARSLGEASSVSKHGVEMTVRSLPITPEMRADLMNRGLPMYQIKSGRVSGYPRDKGFTPNWTSEDANRMAEAYLRGRYPTWEKTQSHEETVQRAAALLDTPEKITEFTTQILNREDYAGWEKREQGHAATVVAGGMAMDARDAISQFRRGEMSFDELSTFLGMAEVALRKTVTGFSESAGTTEARKIPAEVKEQPVTQSWIEANYEAFRGARENLLALTAGRDGTPNADAINDLLSRIEAVPEPAEMLRKISKATTRDLFLEYWYFAMLSNPKTHFVNFSDGGVMSAWAIPERAVASLIRKVSGGEGTAPAEAMSYAFGLAKGMQDAYRAAALAYQTGESRYQRGESKFGTAPAWSSQRMGFEPTTAWGKAVDALGMTFRSVGRALMTADEFVTMANEMAQRYALAYRNTYYEGRTGFDFGKRYAEMLDRAPEEIDPWINKAKDFAEEITYKDEMTAFGRGLASWQSKWLAAKIVLPFVQVTDRIAAGVIARTPFAPLLEKTRADIKAGGARRDLALAKMSLGTMTMAMFAAMAAEGIITGSPNPDKQAMLKNIDPGWQPRSIRIGDTYYSYDRWGIFGTLLQMPAEAVEYWDQIPEGELASFVFSLGAAFAESMTDKFFLRGISDIITAVKDSTGKRGERYAKSLAGSMIPAIIKQAERNVDSRILDKHTWMDEWKSWWPWMSFDVPAKMNRFGEDVVREQYGYGLDYVLPVAKTTARGNAVRDELIANSINLPMPPRVLEGRRPPAGIFAMREAPAATGIELTPEEYRNLVLLSAGKSVEMDGKEVKVARDTLEEALSKLMETKEYQDATPGPEGGKAFMVRRVDHEYREAAKKTVLGEAPGMTRKRAEVKAKRMEKLTGQPIDIKSFGIME